MRADTRRRWTLGGSAVVALATAVAIGGPAQQAKLTAADGAAGDNFGFSAALSGDTAVVGALSKDGQQGAAYVFTRAGTTWGLEQKLAAGDGTAGDRFGVSAALDGDTALIGTVTTESAYVFTRTAATWTQQQKLVADVPRPFDHFGYAVAVAGDTAVIGAYGQSSFRGAAYVFTRTGTTWTQQAKLTADDAATNDYFGQSVSLAGDTAVIGAPEKDAFHGAAYVFTRTGTTWTQQAKLASADSTAGDFFGISVATAGDSVIAGAYAKDSSTGAAYVFARTGATWAQQAKLAAADGQGGDQFGVSVAVAATGDMAVIGDAASGVRPSAAYVFTRSGAAWTQASKLRAVDAEVGDNFGFSAALSGDTAVVGANAKNSIQGAAYVFAGLGTAPVGYCLPTKVSAKAKASNAKASTLTASGLLDTGPGAPDFSGAATFDVGGFHLAIPTFVAKGGKLTYSAGGVTLTITPAKNGSSRATFSFKAVGDQTGKIDRNGSLEFRFTDAANDLSGVAALKAGAFALHAVTLPTLFVLKAAATLKGGGKDALNLTLGFATDGVVPAAAEDLTIAFGGAFSSTLAGGWVRKGNAWMHAAKAPGVTKATIDYVKGTITIVGSKLDLGAFASGGNAVVVTATRGADARSAEIRMTLAKSKLAY